MNKQISILGTGWLGLPLAKHLIANGYIIKGSTTSVDKLDILKNSGIDPYIVELKETNSENQKALFLENSEILIINIPPGLRRNPESNFVAKIEHIIPYIVTSGVEKVLFISSTSVYTDEEGFPEITSDTIPNATKNAGKQLIETEKLLTNHPSFKATILRFAGLFDSRRHPATMLSKRKNIQNPLAPVNLIHREDCIGVIRKIIEMDQWDQIFNASYPDHPKKSDYYSTICKQMNLPIPDYDFESSSKGKIIASTKVNESLQYDFTHDLYDS